MGHQGDCFGFVFGTVLDGGQGCDNALIVGDFVGRSLLLRDLSSQLGAIRGWLREYIEVHSTQQLVQLIVGLLPDKDAFAADLISQISDCEFV